MNNITKAVIGTLATAGATVGLLHTVSQMQLKPHYEHVLTESFDGLPVGTDFKWNGNKYVPVSVAGYGSVADYPDSFWLTESQMDNLKTQPK